jgi:hypothetical protein
MALLFMLNLGSLYFVALKGATRGLEWQMNLLRVCFVGWCVEVCFHQTVEVYIVDYLIPNTLYSEVHRVMGRVLTVAVDYVHKSIPSGRSIVSAVAVSANQTEIMESVSSLVAMEKQGLVWESDFVQYVANHFLGNNNLLANNAEAEFTSAFYGYKLFVWTNAILRKLARQRKEIQRFVSHMLTSITFGVLFLTWIFLRPFEEKGVAVMVVVVLQVTGCFVASVWYCHNNNAADKKYAAADAVARDGSAYDNLNNNVPRLHDSENTEQSSLASNWLSIDSDCSEDYPLSVDSKVSSSLESWSDFVSSDESSIDKCVNEEKMSTRLSASHSSEGDMNLTLSSSSSWMISDSDNSYNCLRSEISSKNEMERDSSEDSSGIDDISSSSGKSVGHDREIQANSDFVPVDSEI